MASVQRSVRRAVLGLGDLARTKLWPLPAVGIAVALGAAIGLTHLDARFYARLPQGFSGFVFGGDGAAARSILSSLATALITVTSLTFSLTVVTLQLASSQFSPRLLRTFTRDRFVQITLALFLGTFVFILTVLRTVRTGDGSSSGFVPRISVTVTYLLTIASVIGLVLFLAHLAEEIRVETMLRTVHADAAGTVRRTLGEEEFHGVGRTTPPPHAVDLQAARSGFLTGIRPERLVNTATDLDLTVLIGRTIGSSVVAGTPIGWVWSRTGASLGPPDRERIQGAFDRAVDIGFERTSVDDIGFGLRQLTDVATKALSPGINDPTTATHTLGHSSALLCTLVSLPLGEQRLDDDEGHLRVVVPRPDLAELLELAVDQPRRYGSGEPQVMLRLFQLLREVGWTTTRPDQREAVRRELERLRSAANEAKPDSTERARYDKLGQAVEDALLGTWR